MSMLNDEIFSSHTMRCMLDYNDKLEEISREVLKLRINKFNMKNLYDIRSKVDKINNYKSEINELLGKLIDSCGYDLEYTLKELLHKDCEE